MSGRLELQAFPTGCLGNLRGARGVSPGSRLAELSGSILHFKGDVTIWWKGIDAPQKEPHLAQASEENALQSNQRFSSTSMKSMKLRNFGVIIRELGNTMLTGVGGEQKCGRRRTT